MEQSPPVTVAPTVSTAHRSRPTRLCSSTAKPRRGSALQCLQAAVHQRAVAPHEAQVIACVGHVPRQP